jgi:hypothetical protein
MLKKAIFFIISSAFMSVDTSAAQSIVGTGLVDGKKIEIYNDFSWDYVGDDKGKCKSAGKGVLFCGSSSIWKPTDLGSEITAGYRYNDRTYAMIIVEDLGIQDGMTSEFMRKAIIENAATGAGVEAKDIIILSADESLFDNKESNRMVYATNIDGLDIIYTNTISIEEYRTLQMITMDISSEYSEEKSNFHDKFLELVKIK